MTTMKVVPNTGDKLVDITTVVNDFWEDISDANEASRQEMINFIIGVTTIIDRK